MEGNAQAGIGQILQKWALEYLPALHDPARRGVMPKAFPVIDPEAPVNDIMSQSPSITAPLPTPD
jgi:hypothetical protein